MNTTDNLTLKRLVLSPYHGRDFRRNEHQMVQDLGLEDLTDCWESSEQADIYLSNTLFPFSEETIEEFNEKTKLMIHPNSGYDNFPLEFVKKAKFPIVVGNPIRAQGVSEYSLSSLFNAISPLQNHQSWVKGRNWKRKLLSSCHVMIVGQGHIGTILLESLQPLTQNITVLDPFKNHPIPQELGKVDVLIMACSLNESTRGMINSDFLKKCSEDLIFINGARGKLMVEDDLIAFLRSNPKAQAYLDVFEQEPCEFSKFEGLKNITLSSHIAGVSDELDQRMIDFEQSVLQDFLSMGAASFQDKYHPLILQNRIKKWENRDILL